MKLLFDQNLSFKLVDRLADLFPGSQNARDAGMASADDSDVRTDQRQLEFPDRGEKLIDAGHWTLARERGFVIVSKDSDLTASATCRRTSARSGVRLSASH